MALLLNPNTYRDLIRPLLFRLPPETAQKLADEALRLTPVWKFLEPYLEYAHPSLRTTVAGIDMRSPIGLAAGYDKDCERLGSLAALGFGYVVGGTVTLSPRTGNPSPRILRYERQESLVNSLGFPGKGVGNAAMHLAGRGGPARAPAVVSVSGETVAEIVACHRELEPVASAIEVNISSPNTAGLRAFHDVGALTELLTDINADRERPLFVKMPPFPQAGGSRDDDDARKLVLGLASVCVEQGVDALTVANTRPVRDPELAVGVGGLSGRLVYRDMLRMVSETRAVVGDSIAINACGGVFSGRDAWNALLAGADTVQLLTALIYQGPGIVRSINRQLALMVSLNGLTSVSEIAQMPRDAAV